jgi:hypothetical protein
MNVKEIIIKYLKENGYDGLCTDDCGCQISDLCPCGNNIELCGPGYKHKCREEYYCDCDIPYDFTIKPSKE